MDVYEASQGAKTVTVSFLEWFGELGVFVGQLIRDGVTPPFEGKEFVRQLDEVGAKLEKAMRPRSSESSTGNREWGLSRQRVTGLVRFLFYQELFTLLWNRSPV